MSRAIKILGWKNDFIRGDKLKVIIDPSPDKIVESISNILGSMSNYNTYKIIFLKEVNEMENKNYNIHMSNEEFVNVLEKEKMIQIVDPYEEEHIVRPKKDLSKVPPAMMQYIDKSKLEVPLQSDKTQENGRQDVKNSSSDPKKQGRETQRTLF